MSSPGSLAPMAALEAPVTLESLAQQQKLLESTIDTVWIIIGSIFVVFMQAGFAFLEAGSVRAKNLKNILLKNVIDTSVGSIMWYLVGYAFSFGEGSAFIGFTNFALSEVELPSTELAVWLYSMAFAATSATIVSGALAERCRFGAYVVYTIASTGFIYPIAAHWVWAKDGWMSSMNPSRVIPDSNGLLDFAGSGTVHITGGMLALVGASWLGPRKGRFNSDGTINNMPGHSAVMATMGILILWTAWYGFNAVTTQTAVGMMPTASLAVVNTNLSAAAGSIAAAVVTRLIEKNIQLTPTINGILAGLVASSSTCAYVTPYAAFVIGIFAGAIYVGASKLMLAAKIDDPLDAVAVHLAAGMWGLLAAGLFAIPSGLEASRFPKPESCGALYGCGGLQLGVQVMGMCVLMLWAFLMSTAMFFPLRRLGVLRVSTSQEMEGLDVTFHGGKALYMGTHAGTRLSTIATEAGTMGTIGSLSTDGVRKATGSSLRGASNYQAVMSNSSIAPPRGVRHPSNDGLNGAAQFTRSVSSNSREGSTGHGRQRQAFRPIMSDCSDTSAGDLAIHISPEGNDTRTRRSEEARPPSPPTSGNHHGAIRKAVSRKYTDS